MPTVDVLDINAQKAGEISLRDDIFAIEPKLHLLHQCVRRQLAIRRQGTACTKTRSEVMGTSKKPWRQKGSGRARIGTRASPIWRGGGIVFGPKPRDYSFHIPKKTKRLALRSALSLKLQKKQITVLDNFDLPEIRTKQFMVHKKALNLSSALIVVEGENLNLYKSARNVPNIKVLMAGGLNIFDILRHDQLVLTRNAIEYIEKVYGP